MRESIIQHIQGSEVKLRQVCEALGLDPRDLEGIGAPQPFSCLMPDHPDINTPSMTCDVDSACFYCFGRCGGTITLSDLVIAHGKATSRAEAMQWLDGLFGRDVPTGAGASPDVVLDPSLTVRQYAYMLHLPDPVVRRFGLRDVESWVIVPPGPKGALALYEPGYFPSVLFPYAPEHTAPDGMLIRPRVRNLRPDRKNWDAGKIQAHCELLADFGADDYIDPHTSRGGAYGVPQLNPREIAASGLIVAVEGESDVLCSYAAAHVADAMPLPILGFPGVQRIEQPAIDLVDALITAGQHLHGDDWHHAMPGFTIVVGAEPGSAGASFARKIKAGVERRLDELAEGRFIDAPTIALLQWSTLPGKPGDLKDMWTADPTSGTFWELRKAVHDSAARANEPAPEPAPTVDTTPEPAPQPEAPDPSPPAAPSAPIESPTPQPEVVTSLAREDALPTAATPAPVAPPAPEKPRPLWGAGDAWLQHIKAPGMPPITPDALPQELTTLGGQMIRTAKGWTSITTGADGSEREYAVCTPVLCSGVADCAGNKHLQLHVLVGGRWERIEVPSSATGEPQKLVSSLAAIGLSSAAKRKADLQDLINALRDHFIATCGTERVPNRAGWMKAPCGRYAVQGSHFGGIDIRPREHELLEMMFDANQARRTQHPDTRAAARQWFDRGVLPLLKADHSGPTSIVLAIGAAAAAPLLTPLLTFGVSISPVTWLAGLGGGGKTTTQLLCASIFAPNRADAEGTAAIFANANMSEAALAARGAMSRDLPLILDDVMQLPGIGTNSRPGSDAARAENGGRLGMMIHNRKPPERANQNGTQRLARSFRSSAIFSAEVSLESTFVGAKASAGQHRRIQTVDTRPMVEAGLTSAWAEDVAELLRTVGGAPGELLIEEIRRMVEDGELAGALHSCRDAVREIAAHGENTQRESLALDLLGWTVLCEAIGIEDIHGQHPSSYALEMIARYLGTHGRSAEDLEAGDVLMDQVRDLYGTNILRFKPPDDIVAMHIAEGTYGGDDPHRQGMWGKKVTIRRHGGEALDEPRTAIALTSDGMEALKRRPGITAQMIEAAISRGVCLPGHVVRMWGDTSVRCHAFVIDALEDDDAPDDSPPAFDPAPGVDQQEPDDVDGSLPPDAREPDQHGGDSGQGDDRAGDQEQQLEGAHDQIIPDQQLVVASDPLVRLRDDMFVGADCSSPYQDGDFLVTATYRWSTDTYVPDSDVPPSSPALLEHIREQAGVELNHLIELMAEQPEGVVNVAPAPAADAPGWAQLEAKGRDWARALWGSASALLTQALDPDLEPQARLELLGKFAAERRLSLLAKMRFPQWFVDPRGAA